MAKISLWLITSALVICFLYIREPVLGIANLFYIKLFLFIVMSLTILLVNDITISTSKKYGHYLHYTALFLLIFYVIFNLSLVFTYDKGGEPPYRLASTCYTNDATEEIKKRKKEGKNYTRSHLLWIYDSNRRAVWKHIPLFDFSYIITSIINQIFLTLSFFHLLYNFFLYEKDSTITIETKLKIPNSNVSNFSYLRNLLRHGDTANFFEEIQRINIIDRFRNMIIVNESNYNRCRLQEMTGIDQTAEKARIIRNLLNILSEIERFEQRNNDSKKRQQ